MSLEELFIKYFNMERVASDLMDLIDIETLEDFILNKFKQEFTKEELKNIFMEEIGDEDIAKNILEDMGC